MGEKGQRVTPRKLRAAQALVQGAPSTGAALRSAGYAVSVSRCPRANGLSPDRLLKLVPAADNVHALKPLATATLRELLTDKRVPDSTRAATATAVHKLAQESSDAESSDQWRENIAAYQRKLAQAVRVGRYLERRLLRQVDKPIS